MVNRSIEGQLFSIWVFNHHQDPKPHMTCVSVGVESPLCVVFVLCVESRHYWSSIVLISLPVLMEEGEEL